MVPRQVSAASDGRFREYIPDNPFAGVGFLSLTITYTYSFTLTLTFLSCRVSAFYRVGLIYMLNACSAEIDLKSTKIRTAPAVGFQYSQTAENLFHVRSQSSDKTESVGMESTEPIGRGLGHAK